MTTSLTSAPSLVAERLSAQRLAGPPARDPVAVSRHLLAVQAQDLRGARLAVRARTEGLTVDAIDAALGDERSLVITWLCRGTLHLVGVEDLSWLQALTTPQLTTGCMRRLSQECVSPDDAGRAVDVIQRALSASGPMTRDQLAERVAAAGVRTAGQAMIHILFLAALRGLIVRGPMAGRQQAYVLTRDWVGPPTRLPDRDRMLAELARRYLVGHAPAEDHDLARWAGITLRDARAGLEAISRGLVHRPDGLLALRDAAPAAELPAPRLLGPWDPLLVGWKDRSFVMGERDDAVVSGGLFRSFALVDGRAVAVWRLRGDQVEIEPFEAVDAADRRALEADAADVRRYLRLGPLGGSERA